MKLVLLILGLLAGRAASGLLDSIGSGLDQLGKSISTGFNSLTQSASKATAAIENKFDTLTEDAKEALGFGDGKEEASVPGLTDTLEIYTNQQSLVKTRASEEAIKGILSPAGELNPKVLDSLLAKSQQQFLERDYHMALSKSSVREIIDVMDELAKVEGQVRQFQAPSQGPRVLIGGLTVNQQVYQTINALFNNRTVLKHDMLVLSQNLDYLRRSDFDLSGFYFQDKYQKEEDFLKAHPGSTTERLFNIYSAQKDVFESRVNEMETVYQQFNRNMADIFDACEKIFALFVAQQKRAQLVSSFGAELEQQLTRVFELRREFAENLLIYQNGLDSIAVQRDLFATIFDITEEVQQVDQEVVRVDNVFKSEREFDVGLTARQKKRLEDLRSEAARDQQEIAAEIDDAVEEANDPSLTRQEREERRRIREAKVKAYLERSRSRQKEIQEIEQSLKDAQLSGENIDESESDEEFFKRREKEQQTETLVSTLKRKIDNNQITMSEVTDRDIADRIAQKEIAESKGKENTITSDVGTEADQEAGQATVTEDGEQPEDEADNQPNFIPSEEETEALGPSVFDNPGRKLLSATAGASRAAAGLVLLLLWK